MNYKAIIEAILFTMGESVELEKIPIYCYNMLVQKSVKK